MYILLCAKKIIIHRAPCSGTITLHRPRLFLHYYSESQCSSRGLCSFLQIIKKREMMKGNSTDYYINGRYVFIMIYYHVHSSSFFVHLPYRYSAAGTTTTNTTFISMVPIRPSSYLWWRRYHDKQGAEMYLCNLIINIVRLSQSGALVVVLFMMRRLAAVIITLHLPTVIHRHRRHDVIIAKSVFAAFNA